MSDRRRMLLAAFAGTILLAAPGASAESCGLCAREVHLTPALARCLLSSYAKLATRSEGTIAIDLTDCERDRGIIEALPSPVPRPGTRPDLRFMVSRPQLDCLKARIEEPGRVRDPVTRIDLRVCP